MKRKVLLICMLGIGLLSSVFAGGAQETKAQNAEKVVTTATRSTYANEKWYNDMNAAFTAETGIKVQVEATPGTGDDHVTKVNIDLLAGGTVDVIETLGPRDYGARLDAGFFMPLGKALSDRGIDVKSIWGKYIEYQKDGSFYALPYKQEIFCIFYNKKVFDQAGVAYPKAPWTWDDYVRIAQEITTASDGKAYGSFMNLDTPWLYMVASQKGIPFYKEDGSCNFDNPEFAKSLKWYKMLGNDLKVQMGVKELKASGAEWNYYATVDNLGMFLQGNWYTRLLNSQEDYPKDWKYGIVAVPTSGTAESMNNFNSMGYISINKNAIHLDTALTYAVWRAENQWKFESGIPALVNLSAEEQDQIFKATADASNQSITTDDLYVALIDNGLNVIPSDICGSVGAEYNNILKQEAELYLMDQQSLEVTIKNICSRVNEAIKNT
ncbi:extracellular solute-binding protein [uncultured Sphaerochaeta sp.]|uniref:ABC transporter substrate-binding protein n=1 Tax=uncultured Sphaerochaeta sp. TaxID=886478 RepID=UPI002A0A60F0|nr:extracellular solute-binding protein [uncultured Sphaerochaeta sp.]